MCKEMKHVQISVLVVSINGSLPCRIIPYELALGLE